MTGGSDWQRRDLHIPRRGHGDADMSRQVPAGKMPQPNTPQECERARLQVAGYVAASIEVGHRVDAYGELAGMLGL